MKIALIHDYLREYGGAERVLEVLHEMWPDAPLYTSFIDLPKLGEHASRFSTWDIRTSWVQHNPIMRKFHSPLRFLAPRVWESFDLSEFDVVLSSSGWFICRGVKVPEGATHICYIHHPPRNLYGYETGGLIQKYPVIRLYAGIINFYLRQYDYKTAQKVDFFIANSQETQRRVKKFYRRESKVIYPPIDVNVHKTIKHPTYYLTIGRLTYAKRIDLMITACNRLKLPLKIVGTGTDEAYLKSIAGDTIEFLGVLSDQEVEKVYTDAKALLFCARNEDFGMVPVEAMAHGIPVIALAEGGVRETVIDGITGVLFREATTDSLQQAIKRFEKLPYEWDSACQKQAEKFSKKRFIRELRSVVDDAVNKRAQQKNKKK